MKLPGLGVIVVTALLPIYFLVSLPDVRDQVALFSQYLGMAALILMAWGQILATRITGIEALFGGLDRVYVLHKWAGIAAMLLLLLHDTIDADMRGLGTETALTEVAETLGEISLYGLLILVVISVATFVPYHLWKWTHKAMGALFAAGTFHFVFILKPFAMNDPVGLYVGLFCVAGLLAYGWTLLPETMRPSRGYLVSRVERTGDALALTLTPQGRGLRARPGQFGIFRFTGPGLAEPHPFSFSKIGPEGSLRVTVKALGDFTAGLPRAVAVGQRVRVQGPFGRFLQRGAGRQIWVAGGIGITPFLALAEALDAKAERVDLFYCVRSRSQAPHLAELENLAAARPNLRLHLIVSQEGQRLTADRIAETLAGIPPQARVAFCGPSSLREALRTGLRKYGVGPNRFHFEVFEFRTGIGLKRLAAWVLRQSRTNRAARPS